jgi:hypothetical protein
MRELLSRFVGHLVEHPGRLAVTNAGVLGAVHLAPIESVLKTILLVLTCLVTGMSAWGKFQRLLSAHRAKKAAKPPKHRAE